MKNKKSISKGLIVATAISNVPINSLANTRDNYMMENDFNNKRQEDIKHRRQDSIFARILRPKSDSTNSNIIEGSVLEITLTEGQFISDDLINNPDGYETIRVTTTGDKKLVKADYDNLRLSGIPKIDLSNAYSDIIPEGAFTNAAHLTEFKFPIGVETISGGSYDQSISAYTGAFTNCTGLTGNLTIPNTVTNIGDYAFYSCNGFRGKLTIPDSVITIGEAAFQYCSKLTGDLIIPDSVTSIGEDGFYGCSSLNGKLVISNSLTIIEDSTFANCSRLNGNLVIPDSVKRIGTWAFMSCRGFTGDLVIPDSVTYISTWGFMDCSGLNGNLILGNSLTHIGQYAFHDCTGLTGNIVIPESVKIIDYNAFKNCTGFTGDVIIPETVTDIRGDSFSGCNGIEKIVIKIDESNSSTNYKKNMILNLPINKTYIEMPYDFDVSGTWLETSNYMTSKSILGAYGGSFENHEGRGVVLKNITSPIKTIRVTKNGTDYPLEANKYGEYVFNEVGEYHLYLETELGTIYNISFKNNTPVLEPSLEINDNIANIVDNGVLYNDIIEEFNSLDNSILNFSNSNWIIENGVLKSETIGHSSQTENELKINAKAGQKLQLNVKTSSENKFDWGYIYLNGTEVYKKSGENNNFQVLNLDLQEGENTIKFKYTKDSSSSRGDDAILIDYIRLFKDEVSKTNSDSIEYRINNNDWEVYNDAFELNYPDGTKIQIDLRAKYNDFVSNISSQEIIIGGENALIIEEAITLAENSKKPTDISNARRLINAMPESDKKNELQLRLNSVIPIATFEDKSSTANIDIYIKLENMLSLSLDTNSVTFDNFNGTEDLIKENAVNLTINSSLPYKVDAYLASEIQNANKDKTMDKEILNIKANSLDDYKTFTDVAITPITLLDDQEAGKDKSHGIDIKLKGGLSYERDTYKTTIKFVATQK
ncbi:MAG: leucine-rich repeat protein [Clostridium sp.]|nr:leucine-rich repeat protein [Clostridium sp.]